MNYGMDYEGGSNSAGGGFGVGTQESTEKRSRRSYDEQTLIPITISMALKAHGDPSNGDGSLVLADGRPLHIIKIIGAVRNADAQSTNVMYTLEDGTGIIDVKQWHDENDESEVRKEVFNEGDYIKVIGQIKEYDGKKQLVANAVRSLASGNELTHHLLEVVYSAETFKRADSIVPPMKNSDLVFSSGATIAGGVQRTDDSNKERLIEFIQQHHNESEEGVSTDQCVQALAPGIPECNLREMIQFLSEEGQIYSTVNDNFFKLAY